MGPDLVHPGKGLRIIPGKLSGEPHVDGTRIETGVLWALSERGFDVGGIVDLYPELTPATVRSAIALERRLHQNQRAA